MKIIYHFRNVNQSDIVRNRKRRQENFKQELIDVCNNISSEELQNIYRSFIRKAEFCIEVEGKSFVNAL